MGKSVVYYVLFKSLAHELASVCENEIKMYFSVSCGVWYFICSYLTMSILDVNMISEGAVWSCNEAQGFRKRPTLFY